MANNLRRLRVARGWTQMEAAAAFGTTRNQYTKLETGTRRLSAPWIDRAARAYQVDPGEVVQDDTVPQIVGRLLDDGMVKWSSDRSITGIGEVALTIDGTALGHMFAKGCLVFRNERRKPRGVYDGQLALVQTAQPTTTKVCCVYNGRGTGRYHLVSYNNAPEFDKNVAYLDRVLRLTPK